MLEGKGKHEDVNYSHDFLRMNIKDFLNSLHDIKYASMRLSTMIINQFQTNFSSFLLCLL